MIATSIRRGFPVSLATKNRICSRDFRPRMGLRDGGKKRRKRRRMEKIGECEGLVRKSKEFLPINISNPKGESFDAE